MNNCGSLIQFLLYFGKVLVVGWWIDEIQQNKKKKRKVQFHGNAHSLSKCTFSLSCYMFLYFFSFVLLPAQMIRIYKKYIIKKNHHGFNVILMKCI